MASEWWLKHKSWLNVNLSLDSELTEAKFQGIRIDSAQSQSTGFNLARRRFDHRALIVKLVKPLRKQLNILAQDMKLQS